MLMHSSSGLVPISQATSGAVCRWSLTLLSACAGGLIVLVALWVAPQPELNVFSESMMAAAPTGIPESVPVEDGSV